MHCEPRAAIIISARIEGGLVFAGKYAKKLGFCQCVIPGIIISSKSFINVVKGTGFKGGLSGILLLMSPGETVDFTGYFSTFSI
jgi:hypothetical protein